MLPALCSSPPAPCQNLLLSHIKTAMETAKAAAAASRGSRRKGRQRQEATAAENENLTTAQRDALFVCAALPLPAAPARCHRCAAWAAWLPDVVVVVAAPPPFPPLHVGLALACLSAVQPFQPAAAAAAASSRRQKLLLACRQAGWLAGWNLPPPHLPLHFLLLLLLPF